MADLIQLERGGSDMKRLIAFECKEIEYVLEENGKVLFSIKKDELKFDSCAFYNNIYAPADASVNIDLKNNIPSELTGEDKRLAVHVFKCVNEIILNIETEIHVER